MKNSLQKKVFVLFATSFLLLILNQIIMFQKSMIEKYQAENDRYLPHFKMLLNWRKFAGISKNILIADQHSVFRMILPIRKNWQSY